MIWSVRLLVGWSVCHNFLKGRKVFHAPFVALVLLVILTCVNKGLLYCVLLMTGDVLDDLGHRPTDAAYDDDGWWWYSAAASVTHHTE